MAVYTDKIYNSDFLKILTKSNLKRKVEIIFKNQFNDVENLINQAYSECNFDETIALIVTKNNETYLHVIYKGLLEEIYLDTNYFYTGSESIKIIYEDITVPLDNGDLLTVKNIRDYYIVDKNQKVTGLITIQELQKLAETNYQQGILVN